MRDADFAGDRSGWSRRELLAATLAAAAAASRAVTGAVGARAPLHRRPIPSSGETLPIVGLGTYRTLDVGPGEYDTLAPVLSGFAAGGGRVVDSSPMYGRAETAVGDLAARLGLRDSLFLATTVWTSGRDAGVAQMESSFAKLRTRVVDLMQVHNLLDADAHLATLATWKARGRIRYVGVTHYEESAHGALVGRIRAGGLDFVQVNYSIAERAAERELLPLALRSGVAILANRPFAGGAAFRRLADRAVPSWLAERGVATWAQAMLKWVLGNPAVTCAIPATSRPQHLEENLAAGSGWLPEGAERERLTAELSTALGL
jgi:diketogulonate reductase-like aldo/keto reductase